MIYINVKENESLDKSLKKFKKKFEKTGVVKELRARQAFVKPCIQNRMQSIRAAYKQKMQQQVEG
jgi:small subunit ribosomal protein S21